MQCHDDGSLFHIWIILNGYHRTSASSTTHSFEVCKGLKEMYIILRLSWGCTLVRNWLRLQRWTAYCPSWR